jgi:phage major head subunit gpT-like protein
MLLNKSNIIAVFTVLKTVFNKAFEAAPSIWEQTSMKVPMGTGAIMDFSWIARFPKMRKWIGDKVYRKLKVHQYSVVVDDWEATVVVKRNDIEDDQIGIYKPMAQDAGFSAKQLPDEIDADLKNNAFTEKGYDGQYFYDTDHPVTDKGGDVQSVSNKGTMALSAATLAGAKASYGAARTAIMSFTDDEGRPLGLIPDTLEVPPALEATGKILCDNPKLEDDKPNPYYGTAKLVVNPRLTSSTQWMLHVTTRPIKPFVIVERKKPVFVSQTDMASESVFDRAEYKFGAEARMAGGYALWPLSWGSTGTE